MADKASGLIGAAETRFAGALTPDATREVREKLRKGIAEALGLLANTMLCDYLNRWNGATRQNMADADETIKLALSFAEDMPSPYYSRAFFHRTNGDHQAAYDDLATGLTYSPDSLRTRAQMAAELLYLGKFEDAEKEISGVIADAENAQSPKLGMFKWIKGRALFFLGRYDEAIDCLYDTLKTWEGLWYARTYLISALAYRERTDEMNTELAEFRRRFPQGYSTVTEVIAAEQTNPNDNERVKQGRDAFHKGLELAGIPWK